MTESTPPPWPEHALPPDVPDEALACLSEHGSRPVWAEGSATGRIMVILDNPGTRENNEGAPFTCGTRQTLYAALKEAGFQERDVYVTYLLKRRPRRRYDREQAWEAYLPLLHRQIEHQRPKALICMGNTVVQAVLDRKGDVKSLRGRELSYQGIPTIVTYHPLAARRRPQLYPLVVRDLSQASRYTPHSS